MAIEGTVTKHGLRKVIVPPSAKEANTSTCVLGSERYQGRKGTALLWRMR